jgi:hypothetical protein
MSYVEIWDQGDLLWSWTRRRIAHYAIHFVNDTGLRYTYITENKVKWLAKNLLSPDKAVAARTLPRGMRMVQIVASTV